MRYQVSVVWSDQDPSPSLVMESFDLDGAVLERRVELLSSAFQIDLVEHALDYWRSWHPTLF